MGEIRRAAAADVPAIRALVTDILQEEFALGPVVYPDADLQSLPQSYGGPRDTFLVSVERGAIVGTVGVKEDSDDQALLRRLFVRPADRSRGIGSQLIDEAVAFCRRQGYHQLVFRSTNRMDAANRLLCQKSFVEQERLPLGDVEIVVFNLSLGAP